MTNVQRKPKKTTKILIITALICFVLGGTLFFLADWLNSKTLAFGFVFLSLTVAPLLGAIASVIEFAGKRPMGKLFLIVLIFILSTISIANARFLIVGVLPYLYMPPAITSKNLDIYKECIELARNHNEYKNLGLLRKGWVTLDGTDYLSSFWPSQRKVLQEVFSEDELSKIKELATSLDRVMCPKFQRDGDFFLFYKSANCFFPMVPREFYYIFPAGHGVLYSLNSANPNEVDSEFLNGSKPFIN
ncbi:MAG: hypothetical protein ACYSR9_02990, partial [Planctomycetota bacterium]